MVCFDRSQPGAHVFGTSLGFKITHMPPCGVYTLYLPNHISCPSFKVSLDVVPMFAKRLLIAMFLCAEIVAETGSLLMVVGRARISSFLRDCGKFRTRSRQLAFARGCFWEVHLNHIEWSYGKDDPNFDLTVLSSCTSTHTYLRMCVYQKAPNNYCVTFTTR